MRVVPVVLEAGVNPVHSRSHCRVNLTCRESPENSSHVTFASLCWALSNYASGVRFYVLTCDFRRFSDPFSVC